MKRFFTRLDAALDGLRTVTEVATVLLFVSVTVVVVTSIYFRFVINESITWSEEFVRFTLFWSILLAASLVSDDDEHLRVEVGLRLLGPMGKLIVRKFAHVVTLVYSAALFFEGIDLVQKANSTSPAMRFPMSIVFLAMVVGAALIAVFTLRVLIRGGHESHRT